MPDNHFKPFPDPGMMPTKPPPNKGQRIVVRVEGWPPYKARRQSLRSPKNSHFQRFLDLREAATIAMDGRCWYDGKVQLKTVFRFPAKKWPDKLEGDWPLPYVSGVMDTLGGSHGRSFTYLPIVFQDDAQVQLNGWTILESNVPMYEVEIVFL